MQLERITTHTKPVDRDPKWHVIDAEGERLGRLASRLAALLQGKHKADYSRHQIAGDFVVVLNAAKIGVSGNKLTQKIYYRHTGYVGHLRKRTLAEMLDRFPERVIEAAVKGMLPRNKLGRQMLRRLKVYAGDAHPHEAQVNAGTGKAKLEQAETPTRTRRRTTAAADAPAAEPAVEVVEEAAVEAVEDAPAEEAAPRRRTRRAAASADEQPSEAEATPNAPEDEGDKS